MDSDALPAAPRSAARKAGSVVYVAITALLPAALVINLVNHHWFSFAVAVVATALMVPVTIAVVRQSGPAARLVFPTAVVTVLGLVLIGAGLR